MAYTNNYTKEEQRALAVEKVKKTLSKISDDVIAVFNNSTFADYLEFVSRFHYFDAHNTVLIYNQMPSATFLASFKAWEQFSMGYWHEANRPVFTSSQKGKGIGILAPYILKKKGEPGPQGRQGMSYFDYHVVFVFDKTQTNSIPVPSISWDLSQSAEDSLALYNAFRQKASFNILFTNTDNRNFRFDFQPASSASNTDSLYLNILDQANPFLLCSYIIKRYILQSLRASLKVNSEDTLNKLCECVTYIVACYFGLPADRDSFFFVKFWGGNDPKRMLSILNVVQTQAHRIIEELETELFFQKNVAGVGMADDDDCEFDDDF